MHPSHIRTTRPDRRADFHAPSGVVRLPIAEPNAHLRHSRLAILLLRRLVRIGSLHVIDGALLTGLVLWLAGNWSAAAEAQPFTAAIVTIFLVSLNAVSAYKPGEARRDRKRLLSGTGLALAIVTFLSVFPPNLPFEPAFLVVLAVCGFFLLTMGRMGAELIVRQAYARGIGVRRAVIIGNLDDVSRVIQQLREDRNVDQYVVGHLVPGGESDPTALGRIDDFPAVLSEMRVQEVI